MPVEKPMTVPGHRADCECDRCLDERDAFGKALKATRHGRGGGSLGKKFVAGFALGWIAGRLHDWRNAE